MNKENRTNIVLIVAVVVASCLLLLCGALFLMVFMFGYSSFTAQQSPVETTTLSATQLEQCREVMAIQPDVKIEGEYYLYTPGFLDDSLECHLLARADDLEAVFDTAVINPSLTTDQEISPGRYLRLKIENIEPGLYRLEGFWYQT